MLLAKIISQPGYGLRFTLPGSTSGLFPFYYGACAFDGYQFGGGTGYELGVMESVSRFSVNV